MKLLITRAQLAVELAAFCTQLLDGRLGLLFKTRVTAVNMVETARDFAGEFDVRHLILTYRNKIRPIDQDVRTL